MRKIFFLLLVFFLIKFLLPSSLAAQTTGNQQSSNQTTNRAEGEVIELGVTEIKVTAEAPQVKLFNERIKPEFDDIHLEKSFIKEITGEGERFVFEEIRKDDNLQQTIDVEKLLTKLR